MSPSTKDRACPLRSRNRWAFHCKAGCGWFRCQCGLTLDVKSGRWYRLGSSDTMQQWGRLVA